MAGGGRANGVPWPAEIWPVSPGTDQSQVYKRGGVPRILDRHVRPTRHCQCAGTRSWCHRRHLSSGRGSHHAGREQSTWLRLLRRKLRLHAARLQRPAASSVTRTPAQRTASRRQEQPKRCRDRGGCICGQGRGRRLAAQNRQRRAPRDLTDGSRHSQVKHRVCLASAQAETRRVAAYKAWKKPASSQIYPARSSHRCPSHARVQPRRQAPLRGLQPRSAEPV
jgi:hypothetical protein